MNEIISITIPLIFLYIYMILSSIEFGSSIFTLFPKLLNNKEDIETYTNPIWETTTVFLVFFFTSLFTFFPKANYILGTNLLPIVFIGLLFFGLRILGMLTLFYGDVRSLSMRIIFLIGSFGAPTTLSLVLLYMLTGKVPTYIFSHLTLGIFGVVIFSIILLSSTFFRSYSRIHDNKILSQIISLSFAGYLVFLFSFLSYLGQSAGYLFISRQFIIFFSLLMVVLAGLFIIANYLKRTWLVFFLSCFIIGLSFFSLAYLHLPYIVYPSLTIYNSFTDPATFGLLITSFVAGMIVVIPSLVFLASLFIYNKKPSK